MGCLTIDFGSEPLKRLAPLGLKMGTMRGSFALAEASSFEPPIFLQAGVETQSLLDIGAFSSISGGRIGDVMMGRYCAIAPDVVIGANEHPTDWLTCSRVAHFPMVHGWDTFCRPDAVEFVRKHTNHFTASRPTTVLGHDVWIGQGAFIRTGVKLGTGCIVGARSVVTRDVPPYAVVSGLPATIKRYRFPEPLIERLLKLEWWRYSLYDCYQVPFNRIDDAVNQLEDLVAAGTLKPYEPQRVTARDLQAMFAAPVLREAAVGGRP
jgi:acetyltransferase-like isoleucine patch superfamily enzyme